MKNFSDSLDGKIKPIHNIGDKLLITEEFLRETGWAPTAGRWNNTGQWNPIKYDYITVCHFRYGEYKYSTALIDEREHYPYMGEDECKKHYAQFYICSGHTKDGYDSGDIYKFWIEDVNMLPEL